MRLSKTCSIDWILSLLLATQSAGRVVNRFTVPYREVLVVGDLLRLEFGFSNVQGDFRIKGKVVRVEEALHGEVNAGVEFELESKEKERLAEALLDYLYRERRR